MKALAAVVAVVFGLLIQGIAAADQYVRGHYRKDGTYVEPHYRSSPDKSHNNNWSVSPNVNPYTGKQGTQKPTYDDNYGNTNRRRGW
jgi:hypothetical protein